MTKEYKGLPIGRINRTYDYRLDLPNDCLPDVTIVGQKVERLGIKIKFEGIPEKYTTSSTIVGFFCSGLGTNTDAQEDLRILIMTHHDIRIKLKTGRGSLITPEESSRLYEAMRNLYNHLSPKPPG